MAPQQYRALEELHLGMATAAKPGEIVPVIYLDMQLQEQPVDFDRLVELGAVQDASLPYETAGEVAVADAPAGEPDGADAPPGAPQAARPAARAKVSKPKA